MSKRKILCYGTGDCFELYNKYINFHQNEVIAILDSNPPLNKKFYNPIVGPCEIPIVSYTRCNEFDFDFIIIFSYNNAVAMYENLLKCKVPIGKILFAEMNSVVSKNYEIFGAMCLPPLEAYVVINNPSEYNKKQLNDFKKVCRADYVRISTLNLLANQLIENNVAGAVAEAGVFKGYFSSLINELFACREIYLFDTFTGFDDRDMEETTNNTGLCTDKFAYYYNEFKKTSVESVLSVMPNREKCIVKQGYFPETTVDIPADVRFALVSLDMDLYAPMYAGLVWFYERMEKGGYIMVHDYDNDRCIGVKQAADQFRKEYGVEFVPIADHAGSIIIVKQ